MKYSKNLLALALLIILSFSKAQLSKQRYIPSSRRFFEHKTSGKCLTVTQDFSLQLKECNYDLKSESVARIFRIIKSNREGYMLKWATRRIPDAIEGCLQMRDSKTSEESDLEDYTDTEIEPTDLILAPCDPRSPKLNWELRRIETEEYLLRKYPFGPCMAPSSDEKSILAVPCDASNANQLWKFCENHGIKKCDA